MFAFIFQQRFTITGESTGEVPCGYNRTQRNHNQTQTYHNQNTNRTQPHHNRTTAKHKPTTTKPQPNTNRTKPNHNQTQQSVKYVRELCKSFLGMHGILADTQRNDNLIITPKRRRNVVLTI